MITLIDRESVFRVKPEAMNEKVKRNSETGTIAGRSYAKGWNACLKMWHEEIEKIPLVERTKGQWLPIIETNEFGEPYQAGVYCSRCGHATVYETSFCPDCGVIMDGNPMPEIYTWKCSEIPNGCENLQSTCNEVATDCINRQTTADEIGKRAERCAERFGTDDPFWEGLMIAKNIVECAPFVRPERKKGVWKTVAFLTSECSECHEQIHELEYGNFCPCCGADMRGEQE